MTLKYYRVYVTVKQERMFLVEAQDDSEIYEAANQFAAEIENNPKETDIMVHEDTKSFWQYLRDVAHHPVFNIQKKGYFEND
jgi:hypothetical protein